MIKVICSGCRRILEIPLGYVGRRVGCAGCGTRTVVPEGKTEEIDVSAWMRAVDSASESETDSIEVPIWTPELTSQFAQALREKYGLRPQ